MDEDKELAVGLHWAFWRSLTEKVRDANEQLKLFFQEDAKKGQGRKRVEGNARDAAGHRQVGRQGRSLQGARPVRRGNEAAGDVLQRRALPRRAR